ncbi:pyridoxamine 5'-phosphate oxidase family protein [bacterium BFN5]|nr:pyridoxamine 5'-phosphate oxidase family protein [bacterium BFN5]
MLPQVWMTEAAAVEFLNTNVVGRLATCDEQGQPYVIAVNYVYHQGKLYFHCKNSGHKLNNLAVNNKVCFEVSQIDELVIAEQACKSSTRYTSVVAFGEASILEDPQAKADILNALMSSHLQHQDYHQITAPMVEGCSVIEITITKLTGKQNVNPA